MTIIRSLEDFDKAISEKAIQVLTTVPAEVLAEFRGQLEFVPGGLAHSKYGMLRPFVADAQFPVLFSFFGISAEKFAIIQNSYCGAGTGKCFYSKYSVCDPDLCKQNGPG